MAELALAGPHRHGRVALRELDRVVALLDRVREILRRLVLAVADEALLRLAEHGRRRRDLAEIPGDASDRGQVGRQLRRHEDTAVRLELDRRAGTGEQLVGGLRAPGHDDEVAVDRLPVDRDPSQKTLAPFRLDRLRPSLAEVDELGDRDPCPAQVFDGAEAAVVDGEHDRPLPGLERPVVDEPAHRGREHHSDEVVAREDERLVGRPGCAHDVIGAKADQDVAVLDGHEAALVDPDRTGRREDLDARSSGALHECPRLGDAVGQGQERASRFGAFVDESDPLASSGRVDRRLEASSASADHEPVHVAVLDVEALGSRGVGIELAEACGIPEELLVERPEAPGANEGLVVEAGRRERAAELVGHGHPVALERAEDVLGLDGRVGGERGDTDAHVRDAVHGHQAVGAMPRAAHEPAWAVVLEAPGEHPPAGRIERRADRVSREPAHGLPFVEEADLLGAVDPFVRLRRQAHQAGTSTFSTSFVTVFRSARNQFSHAWWNHHSRCTPATLSLKYT